MASVVCHFERGEKSFLFLHAEKLNLAKCSRTAVNFEQFFPGPA